MGSGQGPAPSPPAFTLVCCSWAALASPRGAAEGLWPPLRADFLQRFFSPSTLGTCHGNPVEPPPHLIPWHWVLLQIWGEEWPHCLATAGPVVEGAPLSLP